MGEIKTVEVQGKELQYIDFKDKTHKSPNTSVDGLVVKINKETKDKMLDTGGLYRDLLTPLTQHESIDKVIILTVTTKGMICLTGYYFESQNVIVDCTLAKEPSLAFHYKFHLDQKEVPYENINSLEFMKVSNNNYSYLLDNYYSPTCVNDSGIVMNGEIIPYGSNLVIENFGKLVEKFPKLKESPIGKLNADKLILKMHNSPRIAGIVGLAEVVTKEGHKVSDLESYYVNYHHSSREEENKDNFEDFKEMIIIDHIHSEALSANKQIDRRPKMKEEFIQKAVKNHEQFVNENNDPVKEYVQLDVLLEAIKLNLVKKGGIKNE